MKTITIHGLDEKIEKEICGRAKIENTSINKTLKKILTKALGGNDREERKAAFMDLFGTWTKAEEKAFADAVHDLEIIHPEDWK